jgi:hypothetical protein
MHKAIQVGWLVGTSRLPVLPLFCFFPYPELTLVITF